MSGKRLLLLIIIISLAGFSRDAVDIPYDIPALADDLRTVFSEHTKHEQIATQIYRLRQKYMFDRPYYYTPADGSLSVTLYDSFSVKRGIPFELQEKIILDSISELFGSQPKREPIYVRLRPSYVFALIREDYVWYTSKNLGIRCKVALSIRHIKSRYVTFYRISYLWLKPESISFEFNVEHAKD